jgi:hypothetical protein
MLAGQANGKPPQNLSSAKLMTPVSKPLVLQSLLQALGAIILGNVAYFFLASIFPLPHHQPFQLDAGLLVDFWFCVVAYGLIRTARRWK